MTSEQTQDHFRDVTQKVMTPEQAAIAFLEMHAHRVNDDYSGPYARYETNRLQVNWLVELIQAQREQAVKEANTQLKAQVAACVTYLHFMTDQKNWAPSYVRDDGSRSYSEFGEGCCFECCGGCCQAVEDGQEMASNLLNNLTTTAQQHDEAVRLAERERIIALLNSCKVNFPVKGQPDYVYDVDYLDHQKAIKAIEGGEG